MPSSSSTNALARRARRCAANPSRANSVRSCRDSGSRKPGWTMRFGRVGFGLVRKGERRILRESGYKCQYTEYDKYTLCADNRRRLVIKNTLEQTSRDFGE